MYLTGKEEEVYFEMMNIAQTDDEERIAHLIAG
jgi:hypothetical protein